MAVTTRTTTRRHPVSALVWVLGVGCMAMTPAMAKDAPAKTGYFNEANLGYSVPKPPVPGSALSIAELKKVHAAQQTSESRLTQAYEDALAYRYDELLPRFSVAAGAPLSLRSRPILAHMLRITLQDVGGYIATAKNDNPRPRPYVEDPRILPCETDFLRTSDQKSYPSGHAANGYAAALLLARVMDERRVPILARGVRYGDNRVVCGVHHPLDVAQGRLVASAYFDKAALSPTFQQDLACAREEHAHSAAVRKTSNYVPLSTTCQALFDLYKAEAVKTVADSEEKARSFEPQ